MLPKYELFVKILRQGCYAFIFLDSLGKGPQVPGRQMNGRGEGEPKICNVLSPGLWQDKV